MAGGPGKVEAAERLKLAETLLETDDLATCARCALDWLGRSAGVTRGLCLVGSQESPSVLQPVATLAVRSTRAQSFTLDLETHNDPLVAATVRLEASIFGRNGRPAPRTPLESSRLIAIPLHARQALEEYPIGLLLVAPIDPEIETEAKWVAGLLGPRLTALRAAQRRQEGERRSLRERTLLYNIINAVSDPVLLTDTEGRIIVANARAEVLLSSGEDDSEGRRRAVALNNMLFSSALTRRAIEGAEPWRHELLLVDPAAGAEARRTVQANDAHFSSFVSNLFFEPGALRRSGSIGLVDPRTGAPLPVEAISGKIVSEHGEVTATVTILHDRTEELERARLYEQLKRASSELEQKVREATAELTRQNELLRRSHFEIEQASAAKSQFLANMSHEFRTPLNAILGYTSMLLKGVTGELTPHQRRNLERVDSNAHHLLAIINDILDISRIEAGKMPLNLTQFDLKDLVAEVLAEVEPIISRSQLAVTSHLAGDVPLLKTDRQKIKQIVINFLTNAIKFTPQGSVEVRAGYILDMDHIAISVADTGIGISPEDRERIFEDFRQADNSPTREYTGAGLGLAICRRLAGMLDGAITLESEVGRGSTFTLSVPREVKRA